MDLFSETCGVLNAVSAMLMIHNNYSLVLTYFEVDDLFRLGNSSPAATGRCTSVSCKPSGSD